MKTGTLQLYTSIILILPLCIWGGCRDNKDSFEKAMVTFRFDDAYRSQLPLLHRLASLNMRGTVYCITGSVGQGPYMSWDELEILHKQGHEIGSHGMTHCYLPFTGPKRHEEEVVRSRDILRTRGFSADTFAYPYGFPNPFLDSRARKTYHAAGIYPHLSAGSLNTADTDPYRICCIEATGPDRIISLIREAVASQHWLVISFHTIGGSPGKYNASQETASSIIKIVNLYREQGLIEVVTMKEGAEKLVK